MYISKIFLDSFGKFDRGEVDLNEGLNCIYGKNEDGKSTIKSFLAYILSSLHQPYSYNRIADSYKRYEPFNSDEFKGHLLCGDILESKDQVKIFQDFKQMEQPLVTNDFGEVIDIGSDKINVIGFHELQGENSKDLLLDILNRIEDLKNSNLFGIHANDIFSKINAIPDTYKDEVHFLDLKQEVAEIDDFLKDFDQKYADYKSVSAKIYKSKKEMADIERTINQLDNKIEKANVLAIIKLQESVKDINSEIEQYQKQLAELEVYSDADISEAETTLAANKEMDSVKITIKDKKDELYETEKKIRIMGMGRDFKNIIKLTYEDNISYLRGICRELIEHSNKIDNIRNSIMDYIELRDDSRGQSNGEVELDFDTAVLAKDYFKYVNMNDWGNSIKRELSEIESKSPDASTIKILESKAKQMRTLSLVGVVVAVVGVSLAVLINMLFLILAIVGFGVAGFFAYLFVITRDANEQQKAEISTYQLEVKKYKQMIIDNDEKKNLLLHRYSCNTEREFIAYYNTYKDAHASNEEIESKITILEGDLRDQEMAMKLSVSQIKDAEKDYGIELQEHLLEPHVLLSTVEEYVQQSKEYMRLYNNVHDLKEEIASLDLRVDTMPEVQVEETNDIEQNSIAYQLASFELERLLKQKEELLSEMTEQELDERAQSLNGAEFFGALNLTKDDEADKTVSRDNKVRISELLDEIAKYKLDANKQETYLGKASKLKRRRKALMTQINGLSEVEALSTRAVSYLRSSSVEVSSHITEKVEDKIGNIIFDITKKYSKVRFTDQLDIEFYHDKLGEWKPVNSLSAGSIDQVYIALRLAIVELAAGNNNYPLVFDDSFVQYDKKRLTRILKYLSTLDRQVIILTCHKRESRIMENLSIDYNCIQLS